MRKRMKLWTSNLAAYLVVVFGILALLSYVSTRHYFRIDLTQEKEHTLSDQTVKVLEGLETDLKVIAFLTEDPAGRRDAAKIFDRYGYKSGRFSYEFVDPDKRPEMAQKYGVDRYETYVVVAGEGEGARRETFKGYLDEASLTNAIIKAVSGASKVVYFTTGHGEKGVDDTGSKGYAQAREALEKGNYRVEKLIPGGGDIPSDASVVVVAGPEKDFMPAELETLEAYVEKGGSVFYMMDPFTGGAGVAFAEKYGISFSDDVVVDKMSKVFGGDYLMPAVGTYDTSHEVTRNFDLMTIYPVARSVNTNIAKRGVATTALATTLPGTWGETDLKQLRDGGTAGIDDKDNIGPLTVVAASEADSPHSEGMELPGGGDGHAGGKKGKLVVSGDSDFAANAYIGAVGNHDFFVNAVNWLAGDEDMISIRPKEAEMEPLVLSGTEIVLIAGVCILGFPLAALVPGVLIYVRRRKS